MAKKAKMIGKKKVGKFIYWTPRIVSIIFLLFLAMFSLDVFGNVYGFWETVVGLLMHNIPSFILLVLLIISWKHELIGGVIFTFLGMVALVSIFAIPLGKGMINPIFPIACIIFLLVGILFLMNWKRKKKS